MKGNNLKTMAACLFILGSFVFSGCARQGMTGAMDKGMEPTMEGQMMEAPMQEKQGQKMDGSADTMMNDTANDDMGTMQDVPMDSAKEKMMK